VRTRDHLANTRTLLAFLRTGLALTSIGLVMDKLEQLEHPTGRYLGPPVAVAGWLVITAAAGRHLLQRRAIEGGQLRSRVIWDLALVAVIAIAAAMVLLWLALT
jgi:uncharacterized membrane protein YidH (DUF202 family)